MYIIGTQPRREPHRHYQRKAQAYAAAQRDGVLE
jgi:hypothetical protein